MKHNTPMKTPVKNGSAKKSIFKGGNSNTNFSGKSTAAKSKGNTKVKNEGNEISNAIEQFVKNTLQPLFGSKQQTNHSMINKASVNKNSANKNKQIAEVYKASNNKQQPARPVSGKHTQKISCHQKCVESQSVSKSHFTNSIIKQNTSRNLQQKQQIQTKREKGKSAMALKFINQQIHQLRKQRQAKSSMKNIVKKQQLLKSKQKINLSSPASKKQSKKNVIDLNIIQKHHSGRVSLIKEELKQETQKIYNIKSTSDRKVISQIQRAQNQMKNQLQIQMANSQQIIKESNRSQQVLSLKHKQQVLQMNRQIQEVSAKLRETQIKRKQMQEQAQNYVQQISLIKKQLNQRHSQVEALNRSNQQFFTEHDKMFQTIKGYQTTISALQRKIKQIQGNSRQMEEKLKQAEQQKRVIKKNAQDVLMMIRQQYKSTNNEEQSQSCDQQGRFNSIYGKVQNF